MLSSEILLKTKDCWVLQEKPCVQSAMGEGSISDLPINSMVTDLKTTTTKSTILADCEMDLT